MREREKKRIKKSAEKTISASRQPTKTPIIATAALSLKERANLLGSILASCTEYSIIGKDLNGNVIAWNEGARGLYGYEPEEILGKSVLTLHDPDDIKSGKVNHILNEVRRMGKWIGEIKHVRKNGERFITAATITLRKDEKGIPRGFTLVSKDLSVQKANEKQIQNHHALFSELEEINKRIREANRLKSEFLRKLSYELRTPLNSVIGFTELIYSGKTGIINKEQKEYLDDILLSTKHLLKIINDVLDISKIEAGHFELYPESIQVSDLVSQVAQLLATFIEGKKIYLNIDISKDVSSVFLDPARFKQVIYHYLSNAIKFTPEYGTIVIRVTPETAHSFRFEVEDNGIGIHKKDLSHLFLEFVQLGSNGTLRHHMGTGLGLSLVKHIVEVQGGRVGVRSVFGKGSIFYAILPRKYAVPKIVKKKDK